MGKIGLMYAGCSDVDTSLKKCKNYIEEEIKSIDNALSKATALSNYGEVNTVITLMNNVKSKCNTDFSKTESFRSSFKVYTENIKSNDSSIYNTR